MPGRHEAEGSSPSFSTINAPSAREILALYPGPNEYAQSVATLRSNLSQTRPTSGVPIALWPLTADAARSSRRQRHCRRWAAISAVKTFQAGVAQLIERLHGKEKVGGLIPLIGSSNSQSPRTLPVRR